MLLLKMAIARKNRILFNLGTFGLSFFYVM